MRLQGFRRKNNWHKLVFKPNELYILFALIIYDLQFTMHYIHLSLISDFIKARCEKVKLKQHT